MDGIFALKKHVDFLQPPSETEGMRYVERLEPINACSRHGCKLNDGEFPHLIGGMERLILAILARNAGQFAMGGSQAFSPEHRFFAQTNTSSHCCVLGAWLSRWLRYQAFAGIADPASLQCTDVS